MFSLKATESALGPDTRRGVSVFCGGRGSASILRELLRRPDVALNLLVNAYDDGLSTGKLRELIPGMLGPSDFRKNIAQLIELSSTGQYAVADLLEYRLPAGFTQRDFDALVAHLAGREPAAVVPEPLRAILGALDAGTREEVRLHLAAFQAFASERRPPFSFDDCSLGNLLFSGVYLRAGKSFNRAVTELARTLGARATILNVTAGEPRQLVALKEDGELLDREARIVGPQSAVPMADFFLLAEPLSDAQKKQLLDAAPADRHRMLSALHRDVHLSAEARDVLLGSDVIIYGPGTQFSSLFPSYRTVGLSEAIRQSRARAKVFVVNLRHDHDIQGLCATDLVDRALKFLGDPDNRTRLVTHILFDALAAKGPGGVGAPAGVQSAGSYKGAVWVAGDFENPAVPGVHSGAEVAGAVFSALDRDDPDHNGKLEIYVDLNQRSLGIQSLLDEFLELDWKAHFTGVRLVVNRARIPPRKLPGHLRVEAADREGLFSEVDELYDWLFQRDAQFFASITGDGEYRLRDIFLAAGILKSRRFGAIYGARNQSRRQFVGSLAHAYAGAPLLYAVSLAGGFGVSALASLRFGLIFSDPLTGFRVYNRAALSASLRASLADRAPRTTLDLTRMLIRQKLEIAEIPVSYHSYPGFTNMRWRFLRGLRNAKSVLF